MIDPSRCLETSDSRWATFSWLVFNGLSNPILILSALLGLTGLPWISRWRWRKWVSGVGALLLVVYLAAISPGAIALGTRLLTSSLPPDTGKPADAIVILGRGANLRPQRVNVAADLWQDQRAPLIFASGRGDAEEIAAMLEATGIPASAILGEPCSSTTEENAQFTAGLLPPQTFQRIILVTDPPHMLRSLLTFRSLGYEVIPHPNPLPRQIQLSQKGFLVFREYLGLVSYGAKGRFLDRTASSMLSANPAHRHL